MSVEQYCFGKVKLPASQKAACTKYHLHFVRKLRRLLQYLFILLGGRPVARF